MATSRRTLIAALAALPAVLRAQPVRAEPLGPPDPAAMLLRSADASAPDCRASAAVESTVRRVRALAVEPTRGKVILVNIAGAELVALEDGREVMRSRVIVGSGRNRTPELASPVPGVRFNPPWYVPASIERELRNSGASLEQFRRVGNRLVQPPGPTNPLGPIRIGLENSEGVFLHGTSNPSLFARGGRTLSHGCVRVERIFEVAAWILDMAPDSVRAAVATGRTTELVPPRNVQVALVYMTAWPRTDGRLALYPDPYGIERVVAPCRPAATGNRYASRT